MQLSKKQITFSEFFLPFLESTSIFEHFSKKKVTLIAYIFRNYGVQKTRLNKYRKSSVSENPLIVNMLKGPKHCLKLQDSTFIIFFHHFCETELENVSVSYM